MCGGGLRLLGSSGPLYSSGATWNGGRWTILSFSSRVCLAMSTAVWVVLSANITRGRMPEWAGWLHGSLYILAEAMSTRTVRPVG